MATTATMAGSVKPDAREAWILAGGAIAKILAASRGDFQMSGATPPVAAAFTPRLPV